LARLGGRKTLYLKMLRRFGPEFGDISGAIDRSLAEKDIPTASRLVHNTKGVAGSIGAMVLFEVAAKLETAISQQSPQLNDLLEQFRAALDAACGSVSIFLADEGKIDP
jgi:two-component system, sensor histidine kinase and response regulator